MKNIDKTLWTIQLRSKIDELILIAESEIPRTKEAAVIASRVREIHRLVDAI